MTKKNRKETELQSVIRYTKKQLMSSESYRDRRDLLWALLEDEKLYSTAEADKIINQFMKGKVKEC